MKFGVDGLEGGGKEEMSGGEWFKGGSGRAYEWTR